MVQKSLLPEAQTALKTKNTFCGMPVFVPLSNSVNKTAFLYAKFHWNLATEDQILIKELRQKKSNGQTRKLTAEFHNKI